MRTIVTGVMVGCFIFAACGKKEKETTYKLETNRAEDMMTRGLRESGPKYVLLRLEHETGRVAAVVTNDDPQENEQAYGNMQQATQGEQQATQGEQQAFAKGDQIQLQQGVMKLGESPAQTYYDGGCQFMQTQNAKDFKLNTPQCSPMYALSKDTGFKYGLAKNVQDDKFSYYRFGLKSYFGKGFDYPFTQQQPVQAQAPNLSDQTNFNGQAPADQSYKMPYTQQNPAEMPHYQQSPMPVQVGPYQYQYQYQGNPLPYQGNGSQNYQLSNASQGGQGIGDQPSVYGAQGAAPAGQGFSASNGQGYPVNNGQGYPVNNGQGYSAGGQGDPYNGGQGGAPD